MPRMEAVGRIDNIEDLDLDPLVIPVIAYTRDKQEVVFDVRFRPMAPTGDTIDLIRSSDEKGNIPTGLMIEYVESCVEDDCLPEWEQFLHDRNLYMEQVTVTTVYEMLSEYYSKRPTKQRSVSHNGRVTSGATSTDAAPSSTSTYDPALSNAG